VQGRRWPPSTDSTAVLEAVRDYHELAGRERVDGSLVEEIFARANA